MRKEDEAKARFQHAYLMLLIAIIARDAAETALEAVEATLILEGYSVQQLGAWEREVDPELREALDALLSRKAGHQEKSERATVWN